MPILRKYGRAQSASKRCFELGSGPIAYLNPETHETSVVSGGKKAACAKCNRELDDALSF
jgi:hypothetical protein